MLALALALAACIPCAEAQKPRNGKDAKPVLNEDQKAELYPQEQLGVMLQLDNMLEKLPHHVWGARRQEIDRQFELLEKAGVR